MLFTGVEAVLSYFGAISLYRSVSPIIEGKAGHFEAWDSSHPLHKSAINSKPKLQTPLNPTNITIDSHPNHFLTKLVCNQLSFGLKVLISGMTPSLLVHKRSMLRDCRSPTVFKLAVRPLL